MKKFFLAAVLSVAGFGVSADSKVCQYSTDYNIEIDKTRVLFTKISGDKFEFKGANLFINSEKAELTAAQSRTVENIYQVTRQTVPKIAHIAADATELALKATTAVMTSFFGEDEEVHQDLIQPIEILADKIRENITVDNFNAEAMDKSFEDTFDKEFEVMMETAFSKYSGKIVGNVISTIFSGDTEELEDFEFRMENMGQEIEAFVESNAGDIEERAESLCEDFAKIDTYANLLLEVEGYPQDGLIVEGDADGFDVRSFNLNF